MDNERVKSEGEIKHGGEKMNIESREENVCVDRGEGKIGPWGRHALRIV